MPRAPRASRGGIVYHVVDRGNARMTLFEDDAEYGAFEELAGALVPPRRGRADTPQRAAAPASLEE